MIVNALFFVSPAYDVPPIKTRRWLKSIRMNVGDLVPSRCGSAWKLGKLMIVNSGLCGSVSPLLLINIVRANSECHDNSVITLIGKRYLGSERSLSCRGTRC